MASPVAGVQELVNRAMDRVAGGRPIPGNRVSLLFDGPEIYPVLLEQIAAARRWIHFENYIFRDDTTGQRFADALCARAREGVRVRVLADWFGSFSTSRRFWNRMRAAGVEVRLFGWPDLIRPFRNLTRDHRKLVVVDGRTSMTGGFCIGNEWSGDPSRGRQPWRDTGVAIEGPAAAVLGQAFAAVWGRSGDPLPEEELAADVPACGEAEVRVVAGEPAGIRASRMTELLLAGAAERVWLTDAYLVAPRGIYRALLDAARENVDVRLLVPGTSDIPHIRNLTRTGYRELLTAGVRIFEWRGAMLHAKSIVADSRWVRIGSTNMNVSSLIANYELDVMIDDQEFAQQMEAQFRRDLDRSVEVRHQPSRMFRDSLVFRMPDEVPAAGRRGLRERRRRTVVMLRAVVGGSQRALWLQQSLGLTLLALLLLFIPQVMGTIFGTLTLYFVLTGMLDMLRRRRALRRAEGPAEGPEPSQPGA
jgi:cardiolipin synthase